MKEKQSDQEYVQIPRTLSESVYNYLKQAIDNGDISEGDKIHEVQLAERFRVSRTPVREALVRLAAEGYIEIQSHREPVVREISQRECVEIIAVLSTLDVMAMKIVAEHIEDKKIDQFLKNNEVLKKYIARDKFDEYLNANFFLHKQLWESLNHENQFLHKILTNCLSQINRSRIVRDYTFLNKDSLIGYVQTHEDILVALRGRDTAKLEALVRRHWVYPSV